MNKSKQRDTTQLTELFDHILEYSEIFCNVCDKSDKVDFVIGSEEFFFDLGYRIDGDTNECLCRDCYKKRKKENGKRKAI